MEKVIERPALFPPLGELTMWATSATQLLAQTFQQHGYRLNRVAPLDGSEPFTGSISIVGSTDPTLLVQNSATHASIHIKATGAFDARTMFFTNGTLRGLIGAPGAANNLITGSAVGDIAYRVESGSHLFSCDAGSSITFSVAPTITTVKGTIVGPQILRVENTSSNAAAYTSVRLYNDQNSASRTLEIDYSSSAYSGALVTNGPTGEQGALGTTGNFPLTLYTNNSARLGITSGGLVSIYSSGTPEKLRLLAADSVGDCYVSFYRSNGSTRKGYFGYGNNADDTLHLVNEETNSHLVLATNGTGAILLNSVLVVESDGRMYGTALHNNSGAVTGTSNQYIASGTYTPTLTNATNVASSSPSTSRWIRVGNVVQVAGRVQITATAAATVSALGISLPIASSLAAIADLSGAGARQDGSSNMAVTIGGDATNDRANLVFVPENTNAYDYNFVFSYTIL